MNNNELPSTDSPYKRLLDKYLEGHEVLASILRGSNIIKNKEDEQNLSEILEILTDYANGSKGKRILGIDNVEEDINPADLFQVYDDDRKKFAVLPIKLWPRAQDMVSCAVFTDNKENPIKLVQFDNIYRLYMTLSTGEGAQEIYERRDMREGLDDILHMVQNGITDRDLYALSAKEEIDKYRSKED